MRGTGRRVTTQEERVIRHAAFQDQVLTRGEIVELGGPAGLLARRVRQGRWQSPLPGVAIVHSGPPDWRSRARAALLYAGDDAALSHRSAAFVWGFARRPGDLIDVSVPWGRRLTSRGEIRFRMRRAMPASYGVLRAVSPSETVVDLWDELPDQALDEAIALLAAALRHRMRPADVERAAAGRRHLRGRGLLRDLLGEARNGVESPLELRYRRIERTHGLPCSALQTRTRVGGRWIRSDVTYLEYRVRVELDGEIGHPGGRTDQDTWRDNAVLLAEGHVTLRYRWRHVVATPCATAAQVAEALRAGGWPGALHPCGPTCTARTR